jgi:prophage regulatory protein
MEHPVNPLTTQQTQANPPDRLLRLPQVEQLTGLRRSALYQRITAGTFPRQVKIGARACAWSENAVREWVNQQIRRARG